MHWPILPLYCYFYIIQRQRPALTLCYYDAILFFKDESFDNIRNPEKMLVAFLGCGENVSNPRSKTLHRSLFLSLSFSIYKVERGI